MRVGAWWITALSLRAGLLLGLLWAGPASVWAERLPVKTYTSADGLGSSAIFHITRDPRGFLWVCSRDGLIRFDGYRFITYSVGGPEADPAIYRLLATRKGVYWIVPNRGTRYRFVAGGDAVAVGPIAHTPSQDDPRIPLAAEPVRDSPIPEFEDSAGNLWGSDGEGLYQFREVDGRLLPRHIPLQLPGNPDGELRGVHFHEGADGSLWIGTYWGLVRRLPDGRMIHFGIRPTHDTDRVYSLAVDRDGRVWFSRREGREKLFVLKPEPLSAFAGLGDFTSRKLVIRAGGVADDGRPQLPERDGEALAFTPASIMRRDPPRGVGGIILPHPTVYSLLRASDDRIWIMTNRGLVVFDGERLQHYTTEQGLLANLAASMAEDSDGDIWIGGNAGLVRLNPKGLTTFDRSDGLGDLSVGSIFEDAHGELHVVTQGWYVSRFRHGAFVTARPRLPEGLTPTWLSNLAFLDSRGELWVATQQNLYRYSNASRVEELAGKRPTAVYTMRDGLSGDSVHRISEDSRGDLWISTLKGGSAKHRGLTRWQRATGKFHAFTEAEGFPADISVSAFAEDRNGTLWFGLEGGGLARYRDGRFAVLTGRDGAPPGGIIDLHLDRSGRLWIASSRSGLSRLDDTAAERPVFKNYTIADGLASNNVRCITEDLSGNIYVGTARGINRLSPETGSVRYYGVADGLAADFVTDAYRDRHGALWFGTFNGLSRLVPVPDSPPQPSPPVFVNGLRIAGVDYTLAPLGQSEIAALELSANQNNLQIDFSSVSVGAAGSLRYQYKLEGADGDWSAPTFQRAVAYASLPPGRYRFLVRAVNTDGAISSTPAVVSFRIVPPVWQRWWFVALAATLVASGIHLIYRYRTRRLLELERVRTRIATDLHDDIGASLSQIAILSEVARQRVGADDGPVTKPLSLIAATSRELVDAMSDIVWAINPKRDSLRDLVQRMRRFASDTFTARGISFRFRAPDAGEHTRAGADVRREVFLVFKESVNNMARHSGCTEAEIEFRVAGGSLSLELRDNGKGFDVGGESADGNGHGLMSMRERAQRLGGRLEILSGDGQGTTVRLRVPLERHRTFFR